MDKIDILIQVLMTIALILIIISIFYYIGTQAWAMQLLKNQCIAECLEINKINPMSCSC